MSFVKTMQIYGIKIEKDQLVKFLSQYQNTNPIIRAFLWKIYMIKDPDDYEDHFNNFLYDNCLRPITTSIWMGQLTHDVDKDTPIVVGICLEYKEVVYCKECKKSVKSQLGDIKWESIKCAKRILQNDKVFKGMHFDLYQVQNKCVCC